VYALSYLLTLHDLELTVSIFLSPTLTAELEEPVFEVRLSFPALRPPSPFHVSFQSIVDLALADLLHTFNLPLLQLLSDSPRLDSTPLVSPSSSLPDLTPSPLREESTLLSET